MRTFSTAFLLLLATAPILADPVPDAKPDADLEAAWAVLGGPEGRKATLVFLQDAARTVPFLAARLQPARADEARITALVVALDADSFETREAASSELRALGRLAEPALRKALGSASAEVRERAQVLLDAMESGGEPPPEGPLLRDVRAVQLLGLLDTPESRTLLERMAAGAPGALQTDEARRSLDRLDAAAKRKPKK